MQQHTTTSTRIACYVSMFAGLFAVVYAYASKKPDTAIIFGVIAVIIGAVSVYRARKNINDMQVGTAGIFMALIACAVAIWQMYNL